MNANQPRVNGFENGTIMFSAVGHNDIGQTFSFEGERVGWQ